MKKLLLVLVALLPLSGFAADSWLEIKPSNRFLGYSGRISFEDPEQPTFCYPGVSILVHYTGSTAEINMTDLGDGSDTRTNYIHVVLDDSLYKVWKLSPGENKLRIAAQKDKHRLLLFKRTECSVGKCTFNGLRLLQPASIEAAVLPDTIIEFIGDSYTCGYGNELNIEAPPKGNPNTGFKSMNENHYMAWGAIAARSLNYRYESISYSGRGIYRNNTGNKEGILPEIYPKVFPDDWESPLYKHPKSPQYIVIHLGTNDFFQESNKNMVDSAEFVKVYANFLKKLRKQHVSAHIICVMSNGISDWWPQGTKSRTRCIGFMQAAIKNTNDARVHFLDIGIQQAPYGEDWHPSISTHRDMAAKLVAFISTLKK